MRKIIGLASIILASSLLWGCGAKDNTPIPTTLKTIQQQVYPKLVWQERWTSGSDHQAGLQLGLAAQGDVIVSVGNAGHVVAVSGQGKKLWSVNLKVPISATPTIAGPEVFVGTLNGYLYALNLNNGHVLWKAALPSSLLAPVASAQGVVVAHTHDDSVTGFDAQSGKQLWQVTQPSPTLLLDRDSAPAINNGEVFVGFGNGKIGAYNLHNGKALWIQPIALPSGVSVAQQMVDASTAPIPTASVVYAAAYNGNVVALNRQNGQIIWQHPQSTFEAMALTPQALIVTATNGTVFALDRNTGKTVWLQPDLKYRFVTAPIIYQNYVVVGDYAGYTQWISLNNGALVGRLRVSKKAIPAVGVVANGQLYWVDTDGDVTALTAQ